MAFNLIDEPWLTLRPVGGGLPVGCSLRQALREADRFEGLVVDLPTQTPALLRQLLLPVVLDALGPVKGSGAWQSRFRAGAFTRNEREALDGYLDEHHERFDLFHPKAPFAQVPGLHTAKDETKGSALVVVTAATGNNVPLFSSRTEGDPRPLSPAEAARWLLHTHCWDTAGIKTGAAGDEEHVKGGKTTGNRTGPLGQLGVVLPLGRTLFDTLLLNLPATGANPPGDRPQWRAPAAGPAWEERAAKGLLDLWTWQSRRILLIPEDTPQGVRVTHVVVAAGDRLRETPDFEPHTAWRLPPTAVKPSSKPASAVRTPLRHQVGKAAWRGLDALLSLEREDTDAGRTSAGFATSVLLDQLRELRAGLPADYPLQVELTGIAYGTQSAIVEELMFDAIPLPLASLAPDSPVYEALIEVTAQAEDLAVAVNYLSSDLRHAAGGEPIPWDRGQRPGELVLHALDPLVRRLLAGIRRAGEDTGVIEQGQCAWEQLARRRAREVADQVISAASPSTFAGRTLEQGGREVTYRLATAEQGFQRRLGEILFRAGESARERAVAEPIGV